MNIEGKECKKCGKFKGFDKFHKNKQSKDGHVNKCKVCKSQYDKNPELTMKRKRNYQENTEEILQRNKKYRQKNAKQISEQKKQYYTEHSEQIKKRMKIYWKTESGKETKFKDSLKKRSNDFNVVFSPVKRMGILDRDNWECRRCGVSVHDESTGNWNTHDKAHIDHIIPLSKGGPSTLDNLQTLCRTCNLSKSAKEEKVEI
jgi:5-methylcytosine-specific restriction endonuclease McrA